MSLTEGKHGVLFDLDGTLMHTAPDLGTTVNQILSDHQRPPLTDDVINQTASHGAAAMLKAGFGQSLSGDKLSMLRNRFLADYEALDHKGSQLFNGVSDAIDWLDTHSIPWGIVTNKPIHLATPLVAKFKQLNNCGSLLGGDSLSVRKPDPAPLHHACRQISVEPEHSLYVGDAQRDIEAGRNAGMQTMLAQWGYLASHDRIDRWGADWHCPTATELASYLKQWFLTAN